MWKLGLMLQPSTEVTCETRVTAKEVFVPVMGVRIRFVLSLADVKVNFVHALCRSSAQGTLGPWP